MPRLNSSAGLFTTLFLLAGAGGVPVHAATLEGAKTPPKTVARNPSAAPAQTYLVYMPDVPLMPGMTELADQSVVFDKAEGRVVESVVLAQGLSVEKVHEYYTKTLPELGWRVQNSDRFLRNGEQLVVKWEKLQGGGRTGDIVRFSLSPNTGLKQEKNF